MTDLLSRCFRVLLDALAFTENLTERMVNNKIAHDNQMRQNWLHQVARKSIERQTADSGSSSMSLITNKILRNELLEQKKSTQEIATIEMLTLNHRLKVRDSNNPYYKCS